MLVGGGGLARLFFSSNAVACRASDFEVRTVADFFSMKNLVGGHFVARRQRVALSRTSSSSHTSSSSMEFPQWLRWTRRV